MFIVSYLSSERRWDFGENHLNASHFNPILPKAPMLSDNLPKSPTTAGTRGVLP
jgi:hypothetical protein